nr:vacuole membrane protein KMS1 [Ipomoea batatas]
MENLTLATQPVRTIRFFILAVLKFLQRPLLCTSSKLSWLFLISTVAAGFGILFLSFRKPYGEELFNYLQFRNLVGSTWSSLISWFGFWPAHICLVLGPSYCTVHLKISKLW